MYILPKSRKMELEADLIGLFLLSRACYNPVAMIQAYRTLEKYQMGMSMSEIPKFLSTHPTSIEREEQFQFYLEDAKRQRFDHCFNEEENQKIVHWSENLPPLKK
jgi:metalloendopeptidase OMA1, mitochondrial